MEKASVSTLKYCPLCKFGLDHYAEINNNRDLDVYITSNYSEFEYIDSGTCSFCLNLFSSKVIEELYSKVNEETKECHDVRVTTSFSCLFSLVHYYIKCLEDTSKTAEAAIDIATIRKIFKPIFSVKAKRDFGINSMNNSNSEINILFEFKPIAYQQVFEAFSHVQLIKRFQDKSSKYCNAKSLDRGHINEITKNCSRDLFVTLVDKYDLLNLFAANLIPTVELINDNIYLKCSYIKLTREIGQSPWEINGVKVCFSSVQDEIQRELIGFFKCTTITMHAGGREDRDVRMLGTGRPTILEVVNPHNFEALKQIGELEFLKKIEDLVNNSTKLVRLINLSTCEKGYMDIIKKYEDSKIKTYQCVAYCSRKITDDDLNKLNSVENLEIIQRTPLRVAHRRTLMDRKKVIHGLKASLINDHFIVLDVISSAGTYIKEFVHSDLGRTVPSLVSLLDCDCDIIQLDVKDIMMDNL